MTQQQWFLLSISQGTGTRESVKMNWLIARLQKIAKNMIVLKKWLHKGLNAITIEKMHQNEHIKVSWNLFNLFWEVNLKSEIWLAKLQNINKIIQNNAISITKEIWEDCPFSFYKLTSTKKLKICPIMFTFIHIFIHIFFFEIHSAFLWTRMDLILSLRCFIDVNAFFVH